MSKYKKYTKKLLDSAGIEVNGENPWDIQIHKEEFYKRVINSPSLGLGESYMDGWWDCRKLDEFFFRLFRAELDKKVKPDWKIISLHLKSRLLNMQSKLGSTKVAKNHYDLSADLYMSFLDPYNQYTCGYFKDTDGLNKAQEQKLDLICRKLQFKKRRQGFGYRMRLGGLCKVCSWKIRLRGYRHNNI